MIRFVGHRMILLSITILLFALYSILIIYYWRAWISIPGFAAINIMPQRKISVIIPARNEEKNIKTLLESLQKQTYPKELTEIIVVDDHSTDNTARVVAEFKDVLLLQLKNETINSYKKKAIETGIAGSGAGLIITTDADCIPGPDWLTTLVAFKEEHKSVFVAAPVCLQKNLCTDNKFLLDFQILDFLVLQGMTGVSVHKKLLSMCNGANLAYEKKAFQAVNGFAGIDHIASGDDMLLMHKIRKEYPAAVHYVKSRAAIMYTQAAGSWKEFFQQRIRWAGKANKYDDPKIFWVLLLVYLFNLSFLMLLIAGFRNYHYWWWALGLWAGKTVVEFPFVKAVAVFFNKSSLMKYFFLLQPVHIFYTIVAGGLGQIITYEWKGRKVK